MAQGQNPLQQLRDYGQSVWNDNLSRELLASGGLQRLIDEFGVVGVTSNPSIFDKAISGSDDYDDLIRDLVAAGRTTDEIYEEIAVRDIQMAADLLRPIYETTSKNSGDGFVSLEVSPTLAHDTENTMTDARRLFARVNRPNVMIKIPGTPEGLPAIEQMLYEGLNINITLLFSLDAYRAVAERYLRALERRLDEGKPVDRIASVASFFVSRVDTEADKRLDAIVAEDPNSERAQQAKRLRGKLAIANAKLAYIAFKEIFESERFKKLQAQGARAQRPLWASTSTKDPAYSDTLYVDELIGPETVQTLAPASIDAFADHGTLGNTLESDLDAARQVFADLEALGVSYEDITDTLVREGVASFAKSFESLLGGLAEKRKKMLAEIEQARAAALGTLAPSVKETLAELERDDVPNRLQSRDPSLWTSDEKQQNTIAQRLGWLPVVEAMLAEAKTGFFEQFADQVRERGYQHAVLLGMGGSSLAPEVFAKTYGPREGFPKLQVLDTTNPDTIARVADEVRGQKTLFIVSTKSGTTVETMSLYRYFLQERGGDASDFIAVTDPGTPLEAEATAKGFWKTFLNPSDIGGRYSALSYFGLVAAASAGVDVTALLKRAARMLPVHDVQHPGIWLGAALGAAHKQGRDKLTLISSLGWEPFGDWLEQLIAESTGKDGVGIIPVTTEPLGEPHEYGDDRFFVYFRGVQNTIDCDKAVEALVAAGQPVVQLDMDAPDALGTEYVRWEIATAVAGGLMNINPFDESNVQEAKDATNAVLRDPSMRVPGPVEPAQAIESVLEMTGKHEHGYLAILAYVDRTPDIEQALMDLRDALRERTGIATTLGYGPRYLHSTGQLHKGGPRHGTFLQVVATPAQDLEIPGAEYSFAKLFAAQSAGDAITLDKRELAFVRVEAHDDTAATVKQLTEAVSAQQPTR
jgi:transaldolase / glucose-6-phosphate isomerase